MARDNSTSTSFLSRWFGKIRKWNVVWNHRWMTLTIGNKLLIGFGIVTLILIITVTASLVAIRDIKYFSDRMIHHDMPSARENMGISRDIYASLAALHGWILTGQDSYKVERKAVWEHLNRLILSTDYLSLGWKKTRQIGIWKEARLHLNHLRSIQAQVESYAHGDNRHITSSFLTSQPIAYKRGMQTIMMRFLAAEKLSNAINKKEILAQASIIQNKVALAISALQIYLVSGDEDFKKQYEQRWAESSKAFAALWDMKGDLSESQQNLLQQIDLIRDHFSSIAKRVITLRQMNRWNRANYLLVAQAEPEASKILDLLIGPKNVNGERLGGLQGEQYFALIANTYGLSIDITRLQWFEWVMLLLGTLISMMVAVITARVICRPLNQAISIAGYIAGGKRDIKIEPHTTKDETGKLLNALSNMQTSIQQVESKLKSSQQEMQYMAFHDSLTGLPNRSQYHNDFERLLTLAERHGRRMALLLIDLDNFKAVNDTLGHDVGDLLLIQVAKRLEALLRKEDFVARLSGDEFAVLLYEISSESMAGKVASKIIEGLNETFLLRSYKLNVTASIGVASYPEAGRDVSALTKSADIAMYRAKQRGRNKFQYYNAIVSEKHHKRLVIENSIAFAIDRDEFRMVYQPIFELQSRKTIGVEALLRWHHPKFGLVFPDYFIPIAEEMGIMSMIDRWVFRRSCEQYHEWVTQGASGFQLSINVASTRAGYSRHIIDTLEELNIPKDLIYLELTETTIMENMAGFEDILYRIKDSGVHISIDDFGKGYSSLSRLNRLPVSTLKIDRSFVEAIGVDDSSEIIIKSIIALAKSLELKVIAEGIETEAQVQFLIEHKCPYGQGFLYSKPLDPIDILAYITHKN